jgi:hypothetical protein
VLILEALGLNARVQSEEASGKRKKRKNSYLFLLINRGRRKRIWLDESQSLG